MSAFSEFDWDNGSEKEQLQMVRQGTTEELRALAVSYDWTKYPQTVLGWIMAQKGIDLATAMRVFLNGDPKRYNYVGKRDVPAAHRATCNLLDTICLRINSGFYLPWPELQLHEPQVVRIWLRYQLEDQSEGKCGRWVFDEELLHHLLEVRAPKPAAPKPSMHPKALLRAALKAMFQNAPIRAYLRPLWEETRSPA